MARMRKGHPGRKLRNYLLDKNLQLSFAIFIVGVTAVLTAVLIAVMVYETNQATKTFYKQRQQATEMFVRLRREATDLFYKQRQEATRILKEQLNVATDMLDVMRQDPDLKEVVERTKKELEKRDAEAVATRKRQDEELRKRREEEDRALQRQREREDRELAAKQRRTQRILIASLVAFSLLFILVVFLYGIVITHKVAGPLYKIGRYLQAIKEGRFPKLYGLRRGDQLVEFYNVFKETYEALKERTARDLELLEEARKALEKSGADGQLLSKLDEAIQEKRQALQAEESSA